MKDSEAQSFLKFSLVPDHRRGLSCISFTYKEKSLPDTHISVTDTLLSDQNREIELNIFRIPKKRRSRNKLYSASVVVPVQSASTAFQEIKITPKGSKPTGTLTVGDLKTVPCEPGMVLCCKPVRDL